MRTELHVQIRPGTVGMPEDILEDFPFESGQAIITYGDGLIVIDLAEADDTNVEQDWYLNGSEDVQSFYIVGDDE